MDDPREKEAKPNLILRVGLPVAVVFLMLVGYWNRNPDQSVIIVPADLTPPPLPSGMNDPRLDPKVPPGAAALLGGLKVGQIIDPGWKVAAISISPKKEVLGAITVLLTKGTKSFAMWILPKGQLPGPSPYETDRHAIYTGMMFECDGVDLMRPMETLLEYVRYGEEQGAPTALGSAAALSASAAAPSASAAPPAP